MALTNKLSAIGDAIREKTGKSELLTLDVMPEEIRSIITGGGGGDIPEEALKLTGVCWYKFYGDTWKWFIDEYGDRMTTENLSNTQYMFYNCQFTELPFALNYDGTISNNLVLNYTFYTCNKMREVEINSSTTQTKASPQLEYTFQNCKSLRKIKGNFFESAIPGKTGYYGYSSTYSGCYTLDEITNIPFRWGTSASSSFQNVFNSCFRLKRLTFSPFTFTTETDYKGATIDLTSYVGYGDGVFHAIFITDANQNYSGITKDKLINSAETLAALYDDPDCYTMGINYSRYNHDSAVETINSLPDVTAVSSGGTSTIKFKGQSGALTPAGAINTLTEEEIAVAAAKGWTVSLA